jgi:hypothetical protein
MDMAAGERKREGQALRFVDLVRSSDLLVFAQGTRKLVVRNRGESMHKVGS